MGVVARGPVSSAVLGHVQEHPPPHPAPAEFLLVKRTCLLLIHTGCFRGVSSPSARRRVELHGAKGDVGRPTGEQGWWIQDCRSLPGAEPPRFPRGSAVSHILLPREGWLECLRKGVFASVSLSPAGWGWGGQRSACGRM